MKPYLLFFAAVYSITLVLLITVLIFGLNLGGLTLLPALIASAFISAGHFVKKEQRLPSSDEKIQLVWGSSAVAIIIGSFFVFFLVLMNPNAEPSISVVISHSLIEPNSWVLIKVFENVFDEPFSTTITDSICSLNN